MRNSAIYTALNYSIAKAAYSEFELFRNYIGETAAAPAKATAAA